jgi:uncharacterized repeat protein (TIGR01451 family)
MKRIAPIPKQILRGALALAALALALAAAEVRASTAANTTISNTATVSYNDAGGAPQTPVTATAQVTVTLVVSAPVFLTPTPPDQSVAQGTTTVLSYTITSKANGPDRYNLAAPATPSGMTAVTPTLSVTYLDLGGTTLAAPAAVDDGYVTVPYDGAGGASVNGIGAGDTIVIGGAAYVVSSVTNKDAVANTARINLQSPITAGAAAGEIVGERGSFTVTVPSGTVSGAAPNTQTVDTTAASQVNASIYATDQVVLTVVRPVLSVTKAFSTNAAADNAGYANTGNAAPSTTLIYKIIATNGGATPASSVAFSDVIPAYLTYVTGSARYATDPNTSYDAATQLPESTGGYSYTAGTRTVAYNPGAPTGTVAGGGVLVLFYQATIN